VNLTTRDDETMTLFDELETLADIVRLKDEGVAETERLEYKTIPGRAADKDKNEAGESLAAFANSMGGLLIFGVATKKNERGETKPTKVEPVDSKSGDYLRRHAPEAVRHPIPGLRSKPIPAGEGLEIVAFDVPQSALMPHQLLSDKVYYHRVGTQNMPMDHGLVELYFGRRIHAILRPVIQSDRTEATGEYNTFEVSISLLNEGGRIGRDVLTRLSVDLNRAELTRGPDVHVAYVDRRDGHSGATASCSFFHAAELYYPGVGKRIMSFELVTRRPNVGPDRPVLFLDVYADETRPRRYSLFVANQLLDNTPQWVVDSQDAGLPPVVVV